MSVFSTYAAFRHSFAPVKTVPQPLQTLTFTAPNTITRVAGSFVGDGAQVGQRCDVSGSALNNGSHGLVTTVAALTMTVDAGTIVNEAAVLANASLAFFDPDGYETWQPSKVDTVFFKDTITGIDRLILPNYMVVSCNGGAADAVPGTADYNWWLSQRTEDPAKQMFTIIQKPNVGTATYSGTVWIAYTALATSTYDLIVGDYTTGDQERSLFDRVYLYVQRVSGDEIQWRHMLEELTP